jgi:hypothetical protein
MFFQGKARMARAHRRTAAETIGAARQSVSAPAPPPSTRTAFDRNSST